jgi:hypothetical protein
MPVYIAHFLMKEENLWLNEQPPYEVTRREERRYISSQLFAANDAEAAYGRAVEMLDGLDDANHDGPGHRTNINPIGIFNLDKVDLAEDRVATELHEPYGIDIGVLFVDELQHQRLKSKQQLSLFARSMPRP